MLGRTILFLSSLALVHCDICSICKCTFVNVTFVEPEPLENVEIIAFKFTMESEPYNANATYELVKKYFYVDCSSDNNVGQINNLKWPELNVLGIFGNFKRSKWKKLEFFPDHVRKEMKVLSLSDNSITEIEPSELNDFIKLTMLNLSSNHIYSVNKSSFGKLSSLRILDLSRNSISQIDEWAFYGTPLKYLNLSGNSLSELKPDVFRGLDNLVLLDLSQNKLVKLSNDFKNLFPKLTTLTLSSNVLTKIPEMPKNLKKLNLRKNKLIDLKLFHTELEVLDVSENGLSSLADINLPVLKILRSRNNKLRKSLNLNSHGLTVLDVSNNEFEEIPSDIVSSNFYFLKKLYLDGNPITQVSFSNQAEEFENLSMISLANCSIKNLQKNSFQGVFKQKKSNCSSDEGLSINFSQNSIESIDEITFKNISLCAIDLSHNKLKTLGQDTFNWKEMSEVNFQENPWNCDCKIQWMLDDLMVHLYNNQPRLLLELRCATPMRYSKKMFVSWYEKTENAFCKPTTSVYYVNLIGGKTLEIWTASAVACVILGCFIVLMMVSILILLCKKPSKKRRKPGTGKSGKSTQYKPILGNIKKEVNNCNDQRV